MSIYYKDDCSLLTVLNSRNYVKLLFFCTGQALEQVKIKLPTDSIVTKINCERETNYSKGFTITL